MNGEATLKEVWEAITEIRKDTGEIKVAVAGIGQWKTDTERRCQDCRADIVALEKTASDNRDRITSGVTTRAILSSLITALVILIPTMLMLWDKFHANVAKAVQ